MYHHHFEIFGILCLEDQKENYAMLGKASETRVMEFVRFPKSIAIASLVGHFEHIICLTNNKHIFCLGEGLKN